MNSTADDSVAAIRMGHRALPVGSCALLGALLFGTARAIFATPVAQQKVASFGPRIILAAPVGCFESDGLACSYAKDRARRCQAISKRGEACDLESCADGDVCESPGPNVNSTVCMAPALLDQYCRGVAPKAWRAAPSLASRIIPWGRRIRVVTITSCLRGTSVPARVSSRY
jgi:hypothetical protein